MQERIQPQKPYNYRDPSRLVHSSLDKKPDFSKEIAAYISVFDFLTTRNSNTALNNWLHRLKHIIELNDTVPNSVFSRINQEFEMILNTSQHSSQNESQVNTLATLQFVMQVLSNLKKEGVLKTTSNLYNLNESFFVLYSKYEPHFYLIQKEIRKAFFALKTDFDKLNTTEINNKESIEVTKEFMAESLKFFKELYSIDKSLKQKNINENRVIIRPLETSAKNINKLFNELTFYLNALIFYKEDNTNLNPKHLSKIQKVIDKLSTVFLFSSFLTPLFVERLNMVFKVSSEIVPSKSPYQSFLQKQIQFIEKSVPRMPINYPILELKNINNNLLNHSYLLSLISILPVEIKRDFEEFRKFLQNNLNKESLKSEINDRFKTLLKRVDQLTGSQRKDAYSLLATFLRLTSFLTANFVLAKESNYLLSLLNSFNHNNQEVNLNLWHIINRLEFTSDNIPRAIENRKKTSISNVSSTVQDNNNLSESNDLINQNKTKDKLQNNFIIKQRNDIPLYHPVENIDFQAIKEGIPTLMAERIMLLDQSFPIQRDEKLGAYISSFLYQKELLILGYEDGTIKVWSEKSGKYKLEGFFDIHREKITVLKVFKNYLLAGSNDTTITLWDLTTFRYITTFRGHRGIITGLYMGWHNIGLGDMEIVLSSSYDGNVKIWGAKSANCLKTVDVPGEGVTALAQQGELFFTASKDQTIRIWDLAQLSCLKFYNGHSGEITSLLTNGKIIVSGSKDRTIRIWNIDNASQNEVLHGHQGQINCLLLDSKENLYSASEDKTIRIWDLKSKRAIRIIKGHVAPITAIQLHANQLFSSSEDQKLFIWDLVSTECIARLNGSSVARDLYFKAENEKQ